MPPDNPLFPARLDHLCIGAGDLERLVGFYRDALGLAPVAAGGGGARVLCGPQRTLVLEQGPPGRLRYAAYALADGRRLAALRERLERAGQRAETSPSPLFGADAFAVRDPDGIWVVLGTPRAALVAGSGLPGRLQHAVSRSAQPERVSAFYRDTLGFKLSDIVVETSGAPTACFLRSDEEHHSFAVFRAEQPAFDHFSLEAQCWNDLRDWADHFARLGTPLFWGPGRHGPGNNLFLMVRDPEGNAIEVSAEIETITGDRPPGHWEHNERTLNLWGGAWMRTWGRER
jgi:catechol 2,3-dioxygenase